MEDKRSKVEIYTDKDGRRRRRLVPVEPREQDRRPKVKSSFNQRRTPQDPRDISQLEERRERRKRRLEYFPERAKRPIKKKSPLEPNPRGNPAVVETYEDARENAMINRDVPTMKNGGEAKTRGMGCAIKGGKFQGVF
jgi:hypothetical protein